MKLDYYNPRNNLLKKYIEGYYFISEDKKSEQIKYYTFPNNFCILSINQKAKVALKENSYLVTSAKTDEISTDIVIRYTEPIEVVYKNAVDEITIYFKPLGVNHFIDSPTIFKQPSMVNVIPFADFEEQMRVIFNQSDREIQIELLENYWLSKFEVKNLLLMEQILADVESDLNMEDIALKYGVSRKHINTLFLKHMGKPPSEYRKIYRFRNALLEHKKSKNLTVLSHSSLFYDQSHFIRDFKTLTKISPGKFFKTVDTDKENIWLFV
jgi:AraC-like DNA-binding protein